MTTTSDIGNHLEAVADAIANIPGLTWTTAPEAVWYPDWDRTELGDVGLTAMVLPVGQPVEIETRRSIDGELTVHVAIVKPMTTNRAEAWADGDSVVDAARKVLRYLLPSVVDDWACVAGEHAPIISREAAKTYNLWISYLTTTWKQAK